MLLLPDLSEWEPNADLAGIKKANGGAIILRACYGASHPDKVFARYRALASALGFPFVGLYMYLVAGQDAAAQARAFISIVGKLAPHEVPMLDLEEGDGDQLPRANTWFALVDDAFGLTPRPLNERSWLYSGLDYAETHGLGPVFASARHTWVAAYGSTEPSLGHTLWQCTDGKAGVNRTDWPGAGLCDTSAYHGTLSQLAALSGRYPPPAPSAPGVHVTTGTETLASLAAANRVTPAVLLELTARTPSGYAAATAEWINNVFAGHVSPAAVMPAGLTWTLPK